LLTAARSVPLVDFGKRKAVNAKKLDTKGHHGRQPPDRQTESTRNGDRQATGYPRGSAGTDGTPGRLPGVGEVPSGPRSEDIGARNGPQGTQAAPQLIRSAPVRARARRRGAKADGTDLRASTPTSWFRVARTPWIRGVGRHGTGSPPSPTGRRRPA
jgi:hypothetical protein